VVDRRAFLRCATAAALTLVGPSVLRANSSTSATRYLSACQLPNGGYAVAEFDPEGLVVRTLPLPDRGHSFALTADRRRAIAFARHPGTFAVAFGLEGEGEPTVFTAPEGRCFFGHGTFAAGDQLLLATENDYDNARGVVGIYDATAGFRRIGEFDTSGVGPHELVMMPDGQTLAIANGGIETHPDAGDAKLNLATMSPSLVFLDAEHGDIVSKHTLDASLHQLSIRHLAVDAAGSVWFGCQYEGSAFDQPPLIGRASPNSAPVMLAEPPELRRSLRNYVGSMAATRDGSLIAASSPKGGLLVFLDPAGTVLGAQSLIDGCGIAGLRDAFVATSGTGAIVSAGPKSEQLLTDTDLAFDNHLART
jgi:hypothetical protein